MVFPGNSGGPVIYKPEIISIGFRRIETGLDWHHRQLPDLHRNRSEPANRTTRIVFEENSGLAVVIPIDYVLETIDRAFNSIQFTIAKEIVETPPSI